MGALRELLLEFGIDVEDGQLKKADRSIAGVVRAAADGFNEVTQAAGKIIGVVSDVARFVGETISAGGALNDAAAAAGMTTAQYQRLAFMANLAGVEESQLTTSVMRLQRAAVAGARGGSELGQVFARLGVSVRGANGQFKDGPTLFREVGLAIGGLSSSTERAAIAQQVFGRSGAALLPMFSEGEAGIARLEARFAELGGGMSGDFVAAADAADDAMVELGLAWTGLKSELVVALIPAIRDVTTFLAEASAWLVRLARHSAIVEAALIGVGLALATLGAVLAPVVIPAFAVLATVAAAVVLPIAALVLLIDDLITFFRGGKSVIGRFLDSLFGVGASKQVLLQVRQAVEDIAVAFQVAKMVAVGTWNRIRSSATETWSAITGGVAGAATAVINHFREMGLTFDLFAKDLGLGIGSISSYFQAALDASRGLIDSFVTWAQERFGSLAGSLTGGWLDLVRAGSGVDVNAAVAQVRAARATGQTTAPAGPVGAAPAVTAPRQRGRAGGARVVSTVNAPITIHGATNPRETARLVGQEVDRRIARTLRGAVAALEPQAPRPAP